MPRGPNGEWRPDGTGPCAFHVAKIATGEIEETFEPPKNPDADHVAASRRASNTRPLSAALPVTFSKIDAASSSPTSASCIKQSVVVAG